VKNPMNPRNLFQANLFQTVGDDFIKLAGDDFGKFSDYCVNEMMRDYEARKDITNPSDFCKQPETREWFNDLLQLYVFWRSSHSRDHVEQDEKAEDMRRQLSLRREVSSAEVSSAEDFVKLLRQQFTEVCDPFEEGARVTCHFLGECKQKIHATEIECHDAGDCEWILKDPHMNERSGTVIESSQWGRYLVKLDKSMENGEFEVNLRIKGANLMRENSKRPEGDLDCGICNWEQFIEVFKGLTDDMHCPKCTNPDGSKKFGCAQWMTCGGDGEIRHAVPTAAAPVCKACGGTGIETSQCREVYKLIIQRQITEEIVHEDVEVGFVYDHLCNHLEEVVHHNKALNNQNIFDLICQGGEPTEV